MLRPSTSSRILFSLAPAFILLFGFLQWIGVSSGDSLAGLKIMLWAGVLAAVMYWLALSTRVRLTEDAVDYRRRGWPTVEDTHVRFSEVSEVRRVHVSPFYFYGGAHDRLEVTFHEAGHRRTVHIALVAFSAADVAKIVAAFETGCPQHCAWM